MADGKRATEKDLEHIQNETRERSATEVPTTSVHEQHPPEADLGWEEVKAQWPSFKDEVRAEWPKLSKEEVEGVDGSYDRLVSALQARYGLEHASAKGQVQAWLVRLGSASGSNREKL